MLNSVEYSEYHDAIVKIRFAFQRDVVAAGGIPGYRFSPPKNVFASVENESSQQCFCPAGPPCAPEGTFNVSLCQYDSPILLTFPHFYLGKRVAHRAGDFAYDG